MSIFQNQFRENPPLFAPSADDAARMSALYDTFVRAGIVPGQGPRGIGLPSLAGLPFSLSPLASRMPQMPRADFFSRLDELSPPVARQPAFAPSARTMDAPMLDLKPPSDGGDSDRLIGMGIKGLEQLTSSRPDVDDQLDRITELLAMSGIQGASLQPSRPVPKAATEEAGSVPGISDELYARYRSKLRGHESGSDDTAINPLEPIAVAARGRYSFKPSTWQSLGEEFPNLQLTPENIFDPDKQELALRAYTGKSVKALREINDREPTPGELFAFHQFGQEGGKRVVGNLDRRLGDLFPREKADTPNIIFRVNPNINEDMTPRQYIGLYNRLFGE